MLALLCLNLRDGTTGRYRLYKAGRTGRNTHESGLIDMGTTNLEDNSQRGLQLLAWRWHGTYLGDPGALLTGAARLGRHDKTPAN